VLKDEVLKDEVLKDEVLNDESLDSFESLTLDEESEDHHG
jgi:hypothetical protein